MSGAAAAQTAPSSEPSKVVEVRVVTESGTVLERNPPKLPIQPGQSFTTDTEAASLRSLYQSGLYQDVRAELTNVPGGVRLDFVVRRNFYVNQVDIQGLKEPPSQSLALSVLRLGLGDTFRESDLQAAIDRLQQTLQDDGLYEAKVTYKLTPHPETRQMDIHLSVTPGPRARIASITIQNQTPFATEELQDHLKLSPGNTVTSDRLNRASDRAHKWLADQDYLGARVTMRRGTFDSRTDSIPLEVTCYSGLQVHVAVEGANVSSGTLHRLLPIYQEGAVDADLLQEGRRNLRDYFEREGYFDVKVSYTNRESLPEGAGPQRRSGARLVTYDVDLGAKQRLVGVDFTGNHYFNSDLLSGRLQIEPAAFASPGKFSSALLTDDVASIRALYEANGFRSVKVGSQTIQDYRGHHGDLFVRFEINEGPQTRVASLTLEGNHALSQNELMGVIGSTAGQPYSEFNVASDRDNILALYYDDGFPDARFSAQVENVPEKSAQRGPRVRLTYHITEGRQEMVARVLVSGYVHTKPSVIAREVELHPGQPLSQGAIVDSQRKLYNLGIFDRVSIAPQNPDGDDPNKTVVVLVDEAKRYTVTYGGGIEAQRLGSGGTGASGAIRFSPLAVVQVSKANFTGRADTLSFEVRASTIQGRALLGYTAPNYFGRPNLSLQMTAYFEKTSNVQTFDVKRYEASVQLAQRVSLASTLLYRYAFRWVLPTNVRIQQQEVPLYSQRTDISEFGISWVRDRRNNPVDATRGDFENVDVSLAAKPIGSSANFLRVFLQNSTYYPLGHRLVFARSFRFGVQTPYGGTLSSEIPLPERFFAGGGTTLRGFGLNQAGPRDPSTGFPVGGQAMLIFNQELRFPMHLPFVGNRLGGGIFYDAGNVYTSIRDISFRTAPPAPQFDPNAPGLCVQNCSNDLNYFSHTLGFAFRYQTPIGPVSVDLGYQLNPAHFLTTTCPPGGGACQSQVSRLPAFQFFVNLGSTF